MKAKEVLGGMEALADNIRNYNVGNSDYAKHSIQPWDIWEVYNLNPWDADIVKRVLRNKKGEDRKLDYEKIIHICKKRIEQIEEGYTHASDLWKSSLDVNALEGE